MHALACMPIHALHCMSQRQNTIKRDKNTQQQGETQRNKGNPPAAGTIPLQGKPKETRETARHNSNVSRLTYLLLLPAWYAHVVYRAACMSETVLMHKRRGTAFVLQSPFSP